MAQPVIMPKAGMSMEEGTVVQWFRSVGDSVEKGDVLLEIETDKVTMEVEAEFSGVLLAILSGEGDVVPVIQTIGWIGEAGEKVPENTAEAADTPTADPSDAVPQSTSAAAENTASDTDTADETTGTPVFSTPGRTILATPAARRAAEEKGLDLSSVTPSGRHGEIRLRDIDAASGSPSPGRPEMSPLAARKVDREGLDVSGLRGSGPRGRLLADDLPTDSRETLSGIRRATSRAMSASHAVLPPVTLTSAPDISLLQEGLKRMKARDPEAPGLNAAVLAAVARALTDCPWMKSQLEDDSTVLVPGGVHIGVAVALPKGLVVPVLRNADRLSLGDIHQQTRRLVVMARDGKLLPDDYRGAVFSVSNLGMYGIGFFTPVVPLPQSGILGVGAVESRFRLAGTAPEEYSVLPLSLTIDHRLIDGAQGAMFLKSLADYLQDPMGLSASGVPAIRTSFR